MGLIDRSNPDDTSVSVTAEKVIVHPKYSDQTVVNDIALIKLSEKVELSDAINTVCVADKSLNIPYGDLAWATGWGRFDQNLDEISEVLMQVELPLLNKKKCNQRHGGGNFVFDFKKNICVGERETLATACQGDSGGPLVIKNDQDEKWYLIGATSYGPSDCSGGGVFTRVSAFYDWVRRIINKN